MIYLEYLLFRLFFSQIVEIRIFDCVQYGNCGARCGKADLIIMHALVKAMYARLRCVATRVGGVPELLADDVGLLVDASSPRELGGALRPIGGRL